MSLWKIHFIVPVQASLALLEHFEDQALATTMKEGKDSSEWHIIAFYEEEPSRTSIERDVYALMDRLALAHPEIFIEQEEIKDWLTESWQSFPPLDVGPFFIFGSHDGFTPQQGKIPLEVNAATAFGTGEHETTKGCLLALSNLDPSPKNPLDMGCGSGILAMAMAKLWDVRVLAVDLDSEAVRVAQENAELNHCADQVICAVSDGFDATIIKSQAPYDLIVANILAQPLIGMARELCQALTREGKAILSGLLNTQAQDVIKAYADQGMCLIDYKQEGDWAILVLQKP